MTEGRVRELLGLWGENGQVTLRACLVAAEARKEGIEEMQDATCVCEKCLIPGHRPLCAVCEAAERLKEKGE